MEELQFTGKGIMEVVIRKEKHHAKPLCREMEAKWSVGHGGSNHTTIKANRGTLETTMLKLIVLTTKASF